MDSRDKARLGWEEKYQTASDSESDNWPALLALSITSTIPVCWMVFAVTFPLGQTSLKSSLQNTKNDKDLNEDIFCIQESYILNASYSKLIYKVNTIPDKTP